MVRRIEDAVIRGELDNRVRGRTTGLIWFVGRAAPVELDLAGDCRRDLAGRRLEFENPDPRPGDLGAFAARQTGDVGDITASRKVKVQEVTGDELAAGPRQRKPFPWHWGNSLHLEWFSATDGRVVIESAAYRLTVSPDAAWDMTPEEEERQGRANAEATGKFVARLGEAAADEPDCSDEDDRNEARPRTEAEAERMLADSEALVDRIQARLDREGPGADYEKILREELDRRSRARGERPLTPEQAAERAAWVDELNRAAAEAAEEAKAEAEAWKGDPPDHPVVARATALAVRLIREIEARGWLPSGASGKHPVAELGRGAMAAAAKLGGALGGEDWPPDREDCAARIVRLKRARCCVEEALLAAAACAEQRLTERTWRAGIEAELRALAGACDELLAELRDRLEDAGG